MNAIQLIDNLTSLGVDLIPNGDRLKLLAPEGAITPELYQQIAANKPHILAALENTFEQRAIRSLRENTELTRAMTIDDSNDPVIAYLAIRCSDEIVSVALAIDADKWDNWRALAILAGNHDDSEVIH